MSSSPLFSVIIVIWNSKAYLRTCLDQLVAQTFQDFEVILVDNGSDDGALDGLGLVYPSLKIREERLGKNRGFAIANNVGARLAHGRWLALLNADAFPEPDWLENLFKATGDYPEFSCFSSRQLLANTPEFLDGTGDAYHISGIAWRRNIGYPADQFGFTYEEVFTPCAAAALYLREAFLEVGGFDEDFFSYFEDVDLGFRLRIYGYRTLYVPDAIVRHIGSATLGMDSDFSLYYNHRNLILTFFKNMPIGLFLIFLPAHIMANLLYATYYTLKGRGKVIWRAKRDAIRSLPLFLRKRREVQKARIVSYAGLLSVMQRGWFQPYRRGKHLRSVLAKRG